MPLKRVGSSWINRGDGEAEEFGERVQPGADRTTTRDFSVVA